MQSRRAAAVDECAAVEARRLAHLAKAAHPTRFAEACPAWNRRRRCSTRSSRRCFGRSSSGGLRLAGATADAATALRVLPTLLPRGLTLLVGNGYPTDAKRSKRAPDNSSTHQPERLASREGAICQSSS
jgi:hypothetical protein